MYFSIYISSILTSLINYCFRQGKFPDCLKYTRVTPVYKGGDRNYLGNYRPISVLPVISRLIEKCFSSRLTTFLETFQLLILISFDSGRIGRRRMHYCYRDRDLLLARFFSFCLLIICLIVSIIVVSALVT